MRKFCSVLLLLALLAPLLSAQDKKPQVPPEIKKIMVKQMKGQELTGAEQEKLDAFQADKSEAELEQIEQEVMKDPAVQQEVQQALKKLTTPSAPQKSPLPEKKAVNVANEPVPTEAQYLALAKQIINEASAKMPAADKTEIDAAIAKIAQPAQISNVAMAYLMNDDDENVNKALYVAATGAVKDAKDAIIANNLGVALKNNEDYQRSLKVLLFVNKLQINSPVILSNLGWTIAYIGDFPTAKMRFNAALGLKKDFPNAIEGLGILAHVEKDTKTSGKYLSQSLQMRFSPAAARAVKENQDERNAEKVRQEAEKIKNDPNTLNPKPIPPPPPTDPDTVTGARWSDAIWSPFDQPRKTFERPPVPDFINGSIEIAVREGKIDSEYFSARQDVVAGENAFFARALGALPPDALRPRPRVEAGATVFPRSYEKEIFALRDLERIFNARTGIYTDNFLKQKSYLALTGNDVLLQWTQGKRPCEEYVQFCKTNHPTYYQAWQEDYKKTLDELDKYYSYSAFWIHRIVNPQLREEENQRRDMIVRSIYHSLITRWGTWSSSIALSCNEQQGNESQITVEEMISKNGKLKTYPEPNGDCHVPTGSFDHGFIAIEATCERLKLTFGAGAKFSVERKFGEKETDDITTFRLSGGVSKSLDLEEGKVKAGSAEIKLEGSYFIEMQNGTVIDHGLEGKVGISGEIGNENAATIQIGAGFEGRITAQSGAKIDAKEPSVEFGGKALEKLGLQ